MERFKKDVSRELPLKLKKDTGNRLQKLLLAKNPEYEEFLKTFKPKEIIETEISEKSVEENLAENIKGTEGIWL